MSLLRIAAINEARRLVFRCSNFVSRFLPGRNRATDATVLNPTLAVHVVAHWQTAQGEHRTMSVPVTGSSSVFSPLSMAYVEFLESALAIGRNAARRGTRIQLGMPASVRQRALNMGIFVPQASPPVRPYYECTSELAGTRNDESPATESRAVHRLNPHCHEQEGQQIPAAIQDRVHEHAHLSARRPILWIEDPVTRFVIPFWPTAEEAAFIDDMRAGRRTSADLPDDVFRRLVDARALVSPDWESQRRAQWEEQIVQARESLSTRQYAVMGGFLPPMQLGALQRYFSRLARDGYLSPGDIQVPLRDVAHNEPVARSLHTMLTGMLNQVVSEKAKPSYCYLVRYREGAELKKHVDREQCLWNMSLVFDNQPGPGREDAWPIFFEVDGQVREVRLGVGEAVIYRGTQIPHWREPLPGGRSATVCFYHFVEQGFQGSLD